MKKLKFYLIILLITSLAFNQDQSFDKSIKDTEEQINRLKASINSGNKEVEKLKTQSKKTKDIIKPYFTTKEKGTGLGLSIVDKIINDHNGSIKFLNTGDGAKVQIIIPK